MRSRYLVDTSAFMRLLLQPELRERWSDRLDMGLLMVCPLTELEILYSATSMVHHEEIRAVLNRFYSWVPVPDRAYGRAAAVQASLTGRGLHRSAGAVDLLVAATAEEYRATVLHYDNDFASVAQVTGQATQWVADRGTVC